MYYQLVKLRTNNAIDTLVLDEILRENNLEIKIVTDTRMYQCMYNPLFVTVTSKKPFDFNIQMELVHRASELEKEHTNNDEEEE